MTLDQTDESFFVTFLSVTYFELVDSIFLLGDVEANTWGPSLCHFAISCTSLINPFDRLN
jgi:hypothetical protein